jgi:S-adenosylhomocysteine hydrolase
MKKQEQIDYIYEIAEKWNFEQLTEEDKSIVLSYFSAQEYDNIRLEIEEMQKLSSLKANSALTLTVKSALLKEHFSHTPKKSFWTIKLPLYRVAAAFLLLICLYFFLPYQGKKEKHISQNTKIVEKTDTIIQTTKDTLIIIKEIIKKDIIAEQTPTTEEKTADNKCISNICPDEALALSSMNPKQHIASEPELSNYMIPIP